MIDDGQAEGDGASVADAGASGTSRTVTGALEELVRASVMLLGTPPILSEEL